MRAFWTMTLAAVLAINPSAEAGGPKPAEPIYQGRSVQQWIKALRESTDPESRAKAADALAHLGPKAVAAVPALSAELSDDDETVRVAAAAALREIGPAARAAVPVLIGACKDPESIVRFVAADALWRIEGRTELAFPVFRDCLHDKDFAVRGLATRALAAMGRDAKEAIPALTRALRDDNPYVRVDAARALWKVGHQVRPILPVLSAALRDRQESVRTLADQAVCELVGGPQPEKPVLKKVFTYPDEALRAAAIQTLDLRPSEIWPWLKPALSDRAASVRVAALDTLNRLELVGDRETVPGLCRALQDPAPEVRRAACRILGLNWNLGHFDDPSAIRIFSALGKAVTDKDSQVRAYAAIALVEVKPQQSAALVSQLVEALRLSDHRAMLKAVEALDHLGQPAVQPLIAALKDRDEQLRVQAAFVLGDIGPGAKPAVPLLVKLLKAKDAATRHAAASALRKIDPTVAPPPEPAAPRRSHPWNPFDP